LKNVNQVVYILWKDIPAQIIVGKGRNAKKVKLSERFEQAIDRCAMKLNLTNTDDYLSQWHKSDPIHLEGSIDEIIIEEQKRIEEEFDSIKLKQLINNNGNKED